MVKRVRSWWKDSKIIDLIGRKKVDALLFEYGIDIPSEFNVDFLKANKGGMPSPGSSRKIVLQYGKQSFVVKLYLIDQKSDQQQHIQIRYDSNVDLKNLLISKFQTSYQYVISEKEKGQDKTSTIIPDELAEYIEFYSTNQPFEYRIEFITTKLLQPRVWWVNQGTTLEEEHSKGILWAPISNQRKVHHWETMSEVREGDIILHYSNKALRYVSQVSEAAVEAKKPNPTYSKNWDQDGRLIRTSYYKLNPDIPLEQFNQELLKVNIEQGPLHSGGGVNQGYLFRFTVEGLHVIQSLSQNVNWPDFTLHLKGMDDVEKWTPLPSLSDDEMKSAIEHIKTYIAHKGFSYPNHLIENFYLSLKSKPFVILAGVSGTGKTKLVELFAEAVGANEDNGQYTLIAVRPDWSDPSDLIGYQDLSGVFRPGKLTEVFVHASKPANRHRPYFICLDEMNLARVEHYFSDLLSIMETRKWSDEAIHTHSILSEESLAQEEDRNQYGGLMIPDNVYVIGTVNMDETTHPFSKKVLDRANTIEFNHIDLLTFPQLTVDNIEPIPTSNQVFRSDYLQLVDAYELYQELIHLTTDKLVEINQVLESIHAHVGFRIRDSICFYMIYNERFQLLSEDEAFDVQFLQKILPRIQGSHFAVKQVLLQLLNLCLVDKIDTKIYEDDAMSLVTQWDRGKVAPQAHYPQSARKIAFMIRRLEEDGFTSYWVT